MPSIGNLYIIIYNTINERFIIKRRVDMPGTANNELRTNNVSICSKLNSVIKDIYNNPVPSLFKGIGLAFFGVMFSGNPAGFGIMVAGAILVTASIISLFIKGIKELSTNCCTTFRLHNSASDSSLTANLRA